MPASTATPAELQREVRRILALVAPRAPRTQRFQQRIDAVAIHPV